MGLGGILAGGASTGFGQGIRDVSELERQETMRQARELAQAQERRTQTTFDQGQADRAAEQLAHKAVAESMGGAQAASAGIQTPQEVSLPSNQNSSATTRGTGVGSTTPAQANKGATSYPSTLSMDAAAKIYKANPNKFTAAVFERAKTEEIARLEHARQIENDRYTNNLKSAQAAGIRAGAEHTRVQTELDKLKVPVATMDSERKLLGAKAQLAAAQASTLTPGISLTDAENAGQSGAIMANIVDGMNIVNKGTGFKVTLQKHPEGYSLVTTDGSGRIVGTQAVRTVEDVKKLVNAGGMYSLPEVWTDYQTKVHLAQTGGLLEKAAEAQKRGEIARLNLGTELTKVELQNAEGAAAKVRELQELYKEPNGYLRNQSQILDRISEISQMVPSFAYREEKYEITREDGTKEKGTRRINRLLEDYMAARPKTTVQVPNSSGEMVDRDLSTAPVKLAMDWDRVKERARKEFKLESDQEPSDAQLQAVVEKDFAVLPDRRAAKYLVDQTFKLHKEYEKNLTTASATPKDRQINTGSMPNNYSFFGLFGGVDATGKPFNAPAQAPQRTPNAGGINVLNQRAVRQGG